MSAQTGSARSIERRASGRAAGTFCVALAITVAGTACSSGAVPDGTMEPGEERPSDPRSPRDPGLPGAPRVPGGSPGSPGSPAVPRTPSDPRSPGVIPPVAACPSTLERRVTRLSDRHLANAMRDLFSVPRPAIETGSLGEDAFIPGKAQAVTGGVATKLQDVVESVARAATQPGKLAIACTGAEPDCARAFIDRTAPRAFRRPITGGERTELMAVYGTGREVDGSHAGGIALVIEAILQSPSFLYLAELGTRAGAQYALGGHELAGKLSFFLRDTVPDEALWQAATAGKLATEAGVAAEVDRLLAEPEGKATVSKMLHRFFDLEGLPTLHKGEGVRDWPVLRTAMHGEATKLIDEVLWAKGGTLRDLLTSRRATVDAKLAALYGVAHPGGSGSADVMLPAGERAGILTRAGLMAVKAEEDQTSVVFRGLLVARGLLCLDPPPPGDAAAAVGDMIKKEVPTERGRAERRMQMDACKGCHAVIDPFGVTFEHYDAYGKFRKTIPTPKGTIPVDAAWDISVEDIGGRVQNAVELSEKLAESKAVRECMVRQVAAYAVGERLSAEQHCALDQVARRFEATGGDLRALVKDIATWPGLRIRSEGVAR